MNYKDVIISAAKELPWAQSYHPDIWTTPVISIGELSNDAFKLAANTPGCLEYINKQSPGKTRLFGQWHA